MALIVGLAAGFVVLLLISGALTAALTALMRINASKARILAGEGFAGADALLELRSDEARTSPLGVLRVLCYLGATASEGAGRVGRRGGGRKLDWRCRPSSSSCFGGRSWGPRASGRPEPRAAGAPGGAVPLRRGSRVLRPLLYPFLAVGRRISAPLGPDRSLGRRAAGRESVEIGADGGGRRGRNEHTA